MSTTPLRAYSFEEGDKRRIQNRKKDFKIPLRLVRLCVLGTFLPALLIAGPIYLRYRVYSVQLYPLTISDQRLIDGKISTTWCQTQVIRVNTTFNAYLMSNEPNIKRELVPVSMTRHLILEDDMKEYWGFYLLQGSSVTVSTCVRWPGASLTIVRGHKHLHECTFIGDDSSEELEELLQVAEEKGLLKINGTVQDDQSPSNAPDKMMKVHQDVKFHHNSKAFHKNKTVFSSFDYDPTSHELDANAMRNILALLTKKTNEMKSKQKENPYHKYQGVYRESDNIDKPPTMEKEFDPRDLFDLADKKGISLEGKKSTDKNSIVSQEVVTPGNKKTKPNLTVDEENSMMLNSKLLNSGERNLKTGDANIEKTKFQENSREMKKIRKNNGEKKLEIGENGKEKVEEEKIEDEKINDEKIEVKKLEDIKVEDEERAEEKMNPGKMGKEKLEKKKIVEDDEKKETELKKRTDKKQEKNDEDPKDSDPTSAEVFGEVMKKIVSQGEKGKKLFQQLLNEIDDEELKQRLTIKLKNTEKIQEQKRRNRRDFILSSPLRDELNRNDEDEDAAIEEGLLTPDGIADDRGSVNETTLNDRSNSEFWSSFSSSEERLLECKGLILNLPLTPHRFCTPQNEKKHNISSSANTVTYRVPANGYYFFVFNSENEVQTNYLRVKFDLLKTAYNTSNPVHACENTTRECSLPFDFWSNERTVLELPVRDNDSLWNEEYVVTSTCEPRTSLYIFCVITVPLLILIFAFH